MHELGLRDIEIRTPLLPGQTRRRLIDPSMFSAKYNDAAIFIQPLDRPDPLVLAIVEVPIEWMIERVKAAGYRVLKEL